MTRTKEDWQKEIDQDLGWIRYHIDNALRQLEFEAETGSVLAFAAAIKESNRCTSDLYRLAELCGISKTEIDEAHV